MRAANKRPRNVTELEGTNAPFKSLIERMQTEESGSEVAVDPATGRPATFLFARVPSADWTFAAVIDDTSLAIAR